MDVKGAKALKRRLGLHGDAEPQPARADVDLPKDAPPVYQWLGVRRMNPETPPEELDEPAARSTSLFSRLGFSFR